MKAILKGQLTDVAEPVAGQGETIVEVKAAGVNRADLLQIAGKYPPPPGAPETLGLESAGVDTRTGKRVMCLLAGGGMAERVAVHESVLMPVPEGMSFSDAAAIPEAFLTAYVNVIEAGRLASGETLLVHAVTSGVGTAAVQLAHLQGARVIGTGRHPEKLKRTSADETHTSYAVENSVDVILDSLGQLEQNLTLLKTGGRLVIIALMQQQTAPLDMRLLMKKRLTVMGTTLRARSTAEKARLTQSFARDYLPRITPVVDSVFSFTDAQKAFARMQANENVGKIVLQW